MHSPAGRSNRTLSRLFLLLLLILAVTAAVDLARGTGGAVWIHGMAAAAEPPNTQPVGAEGSGATLFLNVRLFDGDRVHERTNVLVQGDEIAAVGADLEAPADARVVDGAGKTLMPGLIDSHVHVFGPVLRGALMLGVTTELDMFTAPAGVAELRQEQARGAGRDRADLFSAGILATAPGGHGTEYGIEIPTLSSPDEAEAWVRDRVAEGSDYIKIVVDGGSLGRQFNTLDRDTAKAVIEAAHAHGLLAVVHVARLEDARAVVEDGADGIVHVFSDQLADSAIVALMRERGAFVVPTLAVLESVSGGDGPAKLAEDPSLLPYLGAGDIGNLTTEFPGSGRASRRQILENALASVAALHAAGVPILAGTDSPNPGTAHGASLHRELELLVRAGLTPTEALAAATSVPASAFGLEDRGRIAPGMRADLVLVTGDPTAEITATRDIVGVWKLGTAADRDAYRAELTAGNAAPQVEDDGLISDFEDGKVSGTFGFGWAPSTDAIMGGSSTTEYEVVTGGADGTTRSLQLTGKIVAGGVAVWAGAMFYTGAQPFAPADLSSHTGVSFWARGDGGTQVLMLFAQSLGQMPALQPFVAGAQWQHYSFAFDEFPGLDPSGLQALLFSGAATGEFEFQIDEVRLQ